MTMLIAMLWTVVVSPHTLLGDAALARQDRPKAPRILRAASVVSPYEDIGVQVRSDPHPARVAVVLEAWEIDFVSMGAANPAPGAIRPMPNASPAPPSVLAATRKPIVITTISMIIALV